MTSSSDPPTTSAATITEGDVANGLAVRRSSLIGRLQILRIQSGAGASSAAAVLTHRRCESDNGPDRTSFMSLTVSGTGAGTALLSR